MYAMKVGIIGATGYTGVELVRLIQQHPHLELAFAGSRHAAGKSLSSVWPGLSGAVDIPLELTDVSLIADRCEVVFLALPHGQAAHLVPELLERGLRVVDLGADFRLQDPDLYTRYYGLEHPRPDLLKEAVYGLVELNRNALPGARLIASPGCYPTAVTLASYPLREMCQGHVIATCLSGVSGAGRSKPEGVRYCETHDQARPYNIAGRHRHGPEIEQNLGGPSVVFTPHLVPMSRGIVATVLMHVGDEIIDSADLQARYRSQYDTSPLVVVREDIPSTGDVRGSARAHVHVDFDSDRRVVTAICTIDNLLKGASAQAIQALNVALGYDETTGLPTLPLMI